LNRLLFQGAGIPKGAQDPRRPTFLVMPPPKTPRSGCAKRKAAEETAAALRQVGLTPEQIRIVAAMRLRPEVAAELAGAAPPAAPAAPPPPRGLCGPPPLAEGVGACEAWAARLAARAVATPGLDLELAKALRRGVQTVGKLKDKALRAEKAQRLRKLREGAHLDVTAPEPPDDTTVLPAWALCRACVVLEAIAGGDLQAAEQLDLIASLGFTPCNQELRALTQRLRPKTRKG